MSYLIVEGLIKSYGSTRVLQGLSLQVELGEFVSLLGPSGSGKTTALRCVAGLERPDAQSGGILLNGNMLSGPRRFVTPEKRRLGMVFQNYAVWPHLTMFENVAFPLRIQASNGSLRANQIEPKVLEALALVRMTDLKRRYPGELSGGQQQRVALARALAMSPELLLLDEPLSNLDALLREELGAEIRRLQQELRLTTILVTHDQKEALSLSDRIVLLNHGKIDAEGRPEELYSNPPTAFSAEFLSGAQRVSIREARVEVFLPRRWSTCPADSVSAGSDRCWTAEITARIFLGSEYEYRARNRELSEEIRFFSAERFEPGTQIGLLYSLGPGKNP